MADDRSSYKGPYPTPESRGIDAAYEAQRERAQKELAGSLTGPDAPLTPPQATGVKNPDDEFAVPAAMMATRPQAQSGPGPDQAGNSSGRGPVDPQGQQGGTHGGEPGRPPSDVSSRVEGTPLADADARRQESIQRRGAGADDVAKAQET